jgi:CDP-glucose 4,6-dehydratase
VVCRLGALEGVVTPSNSFWQGRRVLITGHTGFKGSWLWQWLGILGADVTGLALSPDTEPNLFHLARLQHDARSSFGDIRERSQLQAVLSEAKPEIVFHLAAQPLVRRSYREPIATFETNVMGTAHVLDAIYAAPSIRCAVVVTSDKCYRPSTTPAPYREGDALGGNDPYSASKACAEILVECWRRSFLTPASGKGIASVRAGNVIGGGDWSADRLIPDCVRAFQHGRTVEIRNPDAIRPWQHVLDALAGYVMLAERLYCNPVEFGQAWNFGPDPSECETVMAVVRQLASHWGEAARWSIAEGETAPEDPVLMIDAAKARELLQWRPVLDLDDSLAWTAEWYRRQANGESASQLCAEQIGRFERARSMTA